MTEFTNLLKMTLLLLCVTGTLEAETNWHLRVERWLSSNPMEIDIRILSQEDKKEVIAELRGFGGHRAEIQLLRLGDEQTMEKVMQDFRSDDRTKIDEAKGALANVNNPLLIPRLAELLYHPEGVAAVMPPDSDVGYYTRALWAASRIMNIIGARTEFRPEVKSWISSSVRSLQDRVDYATYWCIRQLWEENKEAFLRGDYAAVKPPKAVSTPAPPVAPKQLSQPITGPAKVEASPKQPLASASAAQPKPVSSPLPLLIGAGALALVAVVAVVIWQGRRKKGEQ
jgi:hypothetical protein